MQTGLISATSLALSRRCSFCSAMAKHLSFWIGFFLASLLSVPIAVGVWGTFEDKVMDWVAVLFGALAVLILSLVILFVFRRFIFSRLLGHAETTLDDAVLHLVKTIEAARTNDSQQAIASGGDLTRSLVGWYSWSSLYRWVIGTGIALLVALGAFAGTVLLFEQTRTLRAQSESLQRQTTALETQTERLTEQTTFMSSQTNLMQKQTERLDDQIAQAAMQNEIMTLSLVNQLREQMLAATDRRSVVAHLEAEGRSFVRATILSAGTANRRCNLSFNPDHQLSTVPSDSILGAVEDLARSPIIGSRVRSALTLLTSDRNGGVALGALIVLDRLGEPTVGTEIVLRDVFVFEEIFLTASGYELTILSSYMANFFCADCKLAFVGSYFNREFPVTELSGWASILRDDRAVNPLFGVTLTDADVEVALPGWHTKGIEPGPYFGSATKAWLGTQQDGPVCDLLADFDTMNHLTVPTPSAQ